MNKENVNIGTYAVVDPGEGPGVPSPSLFPLLLDQTEARRAKKIFWETTPLPATYHRGLDDRAPRYLKVWIRFYYVSFLLFTPRIKLPIK